MKCRYLQRVGVKGSAIITVGALKGEGQVLNLTVPGCMIESTLSLQKGDCVTLRLSIPQFCASFSVSMGIVRWVKGGKCGVEFIAMKEKDRLRYNACVAKYLQGKNRTPKHYGNEPGAINWHLEKCSLA